MADDTDTDEFEEMRARAVEAMEGDDVRSMYVGLIREDGTKEYYFGNAVDEAELRETAADQLGVMTRVLAAQSASTVEEVAELAVERAESMDLRP
ncbi:hypothetical protein [Haladaptatus salinisoli]|uniref:hypothetical protein n=1 Tax=Haladaptatus salinisoli TaxID=2884876 RepID=UPI001D0A8F75|nr:hypothetical protein [Haladaptatus salinisoli]